jgi:hypothetical protein
VDWVKSNAIHAKQNKPWATNFGSLLLGWRTFQKRLSENPQMVRKSRTAVA